MRFPLPAFTQRPPIVVCGMPRSGTSLTRDLLNTGRGVLILDEVPSARFGHLFDLVRQLAAAGGSRYEQWRGLDQFAHARLLHLMATTWALASRPQVLQRFLRRPPRRVGMKTPLAELDWQKYEELLGPLAPVWVYCWRSPLAVYESLLSLEWGAHYTPERFVQTLAQSLAAATSLAERARARLVPFDVSLASQRPQRGPQVRALFRALGCSLSLRTLVFLHRWPPVNRRQKAPPSSLEAGEVEGRLAAAEEQLRADQSLQHLASRLGLDLWPKAGAISAAAF